MKLFKKNTKGYFSILALLFTFALMITGLFIFNNYIYIQSYHQIGRDIDNVSDIVAKNGGLPSEDLAEFNNRLLKYPFVDKEKIKITLKSTETNTDCLNTSTLKDETNYIASDDYENMILRVTVTSNVDKMMSNIINLFSINKLSPTYSYERLIISQRIRPLEDIENIEDETTGTENNDSADKQVGTVIKDNVPDTETTENNEEGSESLPPPTVEVSEETLPDKIN